MGLHHFYWRGRERTVAVFKNASTLTLTFVDDEIESKGLQKLTVAAGQSLEQLLQAHHANEQGEIREIIHAVRENVGLEPFF